jgi:hypothetical protein
MKYSDAVTSVETTNTPNKNKKIRGLLLGRSGFVELLIIKSALMRNVQII